MILLQVAESVSHILGVVPLPTYYRQPEPSTYTAALTEVAAPYDSSITIAYPGPVEPKEAGEAQRRNAGAVGWRRRRGRLR